MQSRGREKLGRLFRGVLSRAPYRNVRDLKGCRMKKRYILFITSILLLSGCVTPDTKYYPPKGEVKNVAIMIFGGSEGGIPAYYPIRSLTAKGYPCFIVGYFKTKNTPDYLEMIPLEYFEDAIKTFRSKPEVGDKKIVVWGTSKGGELALLLASRYKEINGVISSSPLTVVFQSIGPNITSSWSYKGKPLPFVPYVYTDAENGYELALKQTEAVEKAAIKVENINGPILLLTGEEDPLCPASQMCKMIVQRLDKKGFPHWYRHFAYEDAGHTLTEKHIVGGTKAGNKKARIDSRQRVIDFLNRLSGE